MVHFPNNRFSLAKVEVFDNQIDRNDQDVREHSSKVNQVDDKLNDRKIIVENFHNKHMTNLVVSNYKSVENLHSLFDQYPIEVEDDQLMD